MKLDVFAIELGMFSLDKVAFAQEFVIARMTAGVHCSNLKLQNVCTSNHVINS